MNKYVIGIAAALAFSSLAKGNPCATMNNASGAQQNCNTGTGSVQSQGQGQTQTATGGAGGSVNVASGAVQNTNNNTNSVTGGSSSSTIASGAVQASTRSNSSVGNVTGGTSSSSVGNVSTGASTSGATASGNGDGSNDTNVVYEGSKSYRNPVNTAYSAALTAGLETCLGSMSGGAQTSIFGITLGGTKKDLNCELIRQTHLLMQQGLYRSACIRQQLGKEGALIKEAMKEAGETCEPQEPKVVYVPVPTDNPNYVTQEQLQEIERRITTHITSK